MNLLKYRKYFRIFSFSKTVRQVFMKLKNWNIVQKLPCFSQLSNWISQGLNSPCIYSGWFIASKIICNLYRNSSLKFIHFQRFWDGIHFSSFLSYLVSILREEDNCISFPVAGSNYLTPIILKGEIYLAHSFRRYSPWSASSKVETSWWKLLYSCQPGSK